MWCWVPRPLSIAPVQGCSSSLRAATSVPQECAHHRSESLVHKCASRQSCVPLPCSRNLACDIYQRFLVSATIEFGPLRHQPNARTHREPKGEPLAALRAKPEVHDCASRFLLTDHGRHILARFFWIPHLIRKELAFIRIEKFRIALGISALSDHGSLRGKMWTSSFIRQNRGDGNELFVLADGKQIPAWKAKLEVFLLISGLNQFPLHRIHYRLKPVVRP